MWANNRLRGGDRGIYLDDRFQTQLADAVRPDEVIELGRGKRNSAVRPQQTVEQKPRAGLRGLIGKPCVVAIQYCSSATLHRGDMTMADGTTPIAPEAP